MDDHGKENTIKDLLNTIKEGNEKTAIHFSAARGKLDIFKLLEESGADIKAKDGKPFYFNRLI